MASVSEVIAQIKSGHSVFIHGAAAVPTALLHELVKQAPRLKNVTLYHLHLEGKAPHAEPQYHESFRVMNLFVGGNVRGNLDYDRIDYIPCFLSEIPYLFRNKKIKLDACLIQVSPPDRHGYCSLGTSVDVAKAAVESSALVLAEINQKMPRVHGDGIIHKSQIDYFVESDRPLPITVPHELTPAEVQIGKNVASLVEDGATIQVGIGSIPDAVLKALHSHINLGIHSEMWSDGVLQLIVSGAVTNSEKKVHPGKSVSSFIYGSQAVYDFINDNASIIQLESSYVNDPSVIARNPKVVAINSAVEIDLTGQVCADSIGSRIISGVGGQMDFIRGASLSAGGKPIIAVTSRSKKGFSRIVSQLKSGAGVVTTRAHIHYVVTEYGVADLYGKSLGERASALIKIAHPEEQEKLSAEFFKLMKS